MLEVKQFEKYKMKGDIFAKISEFEALKLWVRYSTSVNGIGFVWPHCCDSRERVSKTTKLFCALLKESGTWKLIERFMYNERNKIPI